ncbi:cell growth-regulating nucleolar protein [Rhinophrynus dorsalis]
MVFFTCNACGESLKKGQVEKHKAKCRNCGCLSCIDCGKDFWGEDYKNHLKCISEDQKYGGKGFEAKANKGDVKQQQWLQRIQEVMKKPSISSNIRNILNQISSYDNIPRKKAKFQNWMKNSLKIHNQMLQDQVWEIFAEATSTGASNSEKQKPAETSVPENKPDVPEPAEETEKKKSKRERKEERQKKNKKEKKDLSVADQPENEGKKKGKKRKMEESEANEIEAGDEVTEKKKKKKRDSEDENTANNGEVETNGKVDAHTAGKKRKHRNSEDESCVNEQEENGENSEDEEETKKTAKVKFNWKGTIKALLRQAPDNELPIKKLRKKVLAQYYAVSSEQHRSEEELLSTFNKKVQNNPKFRVLKERVKLLK